MATPLAPTIDVVILLLFPTGNCLITKITDSFTVDVSVRVGGGWLCGSGPAVLVAGQALGKPWLVWPSMEVFVAAAFGVGVFACFCDPAWGAVGLQHHPAAIRRVAMLHIGSARFTLHANMV